MAYFPVGEDASVSQPFGYKDHIGTDFHVDVGTPVQSILDGTVIMALEDAKVYGRSIEIVHDIDGYASLYGHLSKLLVQKGDRVKAGQVIGLSGGNVNDPNAGQSSGPHLHFEIRTPKNLNDTSYKIDPIKYLIKYMNQIDLEYCPI